MQHSKRKMIKMMVTVVAVFTICWLPLNVFIILWTVHGTDEAWSAWPGMPFVWFASHWLAMSHSCYNPIIYCYMNARYRRGFKQVLSGCICLQVKDSGRLYQRSSICDGVPMSEMVGVNGNHTISRRVAGCSCPPRGTSNGVTMCTSCASLRQLMTTANGSARSAPARALSVRSHFS